MLPIIWSRPALKDLRDIDNYLTRQVAPDLSVRILTAIQSRARFLERFPRGGRPLHDGTRVLRVFDTPYLIRYSVAAAQVEVIRVHHERENWFVEP